MASYNSTKVFFNSSIKEPVVFAFDVTSGSATIEIEAAPGVYVAAAAAITADDVKAVDCYGCRVRVSITGTVVYSVANLIAEG